MPKLRNIPARFRHVRRYAGLAYGWRDRFALGVLGVARQRPVSSADVLSRVGHRLFSTLVVRPKQLNGNRVAVDPADVGHLTVFDEVFGDNVYDLSLVPFVPEMVLDCGGHIGLFSALAATRFPAARVVAFEPVAGNAAYIESLVALNGFRVEVERAAVGTADRTATFHGASSCGGSLDGDLAPATHTFDVRVVDLRRRLAEWRPASLVLKVDIEGAEESVIPAVVDALPEACAVFFETHRGAAGWARVADALTQVGFGVRELRARDPYRDGFAVRPPQARSSGATHAG